MTDDIGFRIIEATAEPIYRVTREQALGRVHVHSYRGRDGFEALVPDRLIERLCAIGRRAEPDEWLGIIVGRLGEDDRGRYVVVDGVVVDEHALVTPGSVRSTHQGERRVRAITQVAYPGSIVLGWAHGHHRCGTRFSGTDRDNQARWTASHALGIVCDPRTPERIGIYRGPQSERLTRASASESLQSDKSVSNGPEVGVRVDTSGNAEHSLAEERDELTKGELEVASSSGYNWAKVVADIVAVGLLMLAWHLWTIISDMHAKLDALERTVQTLDDRCQARQDPEDRNEPLMSFIQRRGWNETSSAHFVQPAP